MAVKRRFLRIAMLNADTSTPNTYADQGTFGDILHRVLSEVASRTHQNLSITHTVHNVVEGEYPKSISDFDAVMVTASAASSYDAKSWIESLEDYLVKLYRDHSHIKIFGSCFGHHLICQALLKDTGLRIVKSPGGWEIGVNEVLFTKDFVKSFQGSVDSVFAHEVSRYDGRPPSPDDDSSEDEVFYSNRDRGFTVPCKARLQFVHEDRVALPASSTLLPGPWILLGSTASCAVQGVYQPGRVLTLQGHFEFDKFKSEKTYRIFGADGSQATDELGTRHDTREDVKDEVDDGYLVAEMVVRFLSEGRLRHKSCDAERPDGYEMLPTPRSSLELA